MQYDALINAIARKLYRFTRRDIAEMMDVMTEIWREELLKPDGYIQIAGLGKLYVEHQELPGAGIIHPLHLNSDQKSPLILRRVYFRFRPAEALKQAVLERGNANE